MKNGIHRKLLKVTDDLNSKSNHVLKNTIELQCILNALKLLSFHFILRIDCNDKIL